jgi:hypothetical protein
MRIGRRFRWALCGVVMLSMALISSPSAAQLIKSRVMVLLDTSGSMAFYPTDPNPLDFPPFGDYPEGDGSFSYTDRNVCQVCSPIAETCDGKDNDCDGIVDNNLADVAVWIESRHLQTGTTACQPDLGMTFPDASDHLVCTGGVPAGIETCNGLDDDCNGTVDGMSRGCYSGMLGTENVGICHGAKQACSAVLGSGRRELGLLCGRGRSGNLVQLRLHDRTTDLPIFGPRLPLLLRRGALTTMAGHAIVAARNGPEPLCSAASP